MKVKKETAELISNSYLIIGIILIILATVLIIIARFPQVWYAMQIHTTEGEFEVLTNPLTEDYEEYKKNLQEARITESKLPPLDISLPEENKIMIPKIGVDSEIQDGEDYDTLLEKGVWRVNDFGTPEDDWLMIVAAHRFGYAIWSNDERHVKSFYNLPSTRVGDKVEIIWNQRKYVYEIYKIEESPTITDYSADLILYTCKLYNSPVRIFRYANRVK